MSEPGPAAPEAEERREALSLRTARKDGREIVSLRCVAEVGSYVVACTVHPVTSPGAEAVIRGPYVFQTFAQANAFLDEAARALGYLGCDVL